MTDLNFNLVIHAYINKNGRCWRITIANRVPVISIDTTNLIRIIHIKMTVGRKLPVSTMNIYSRSYRESSNFHEF